MQELSESARRAADIFRKRREVASRPCRNPSLEVSVRRGGGWITVSLGSLVGASSRGDVYAHMREVGFLRHDGTIDGDVAQVMDMAEFDDS